MKKVYIGAMLTLIMLLALTLTHTQPSQALSEGWFEYEDNGDGTATITGYTRDGLYDVVIPEEIGGLEVSAIGEYAFFYKGVKSVVIPSSVKTIGTAAFNLSGLTEVTLAEGLTRIESGAFGNNRIPSITIPASVTFIGQDAFQDNPNQTVSKPGEFIVRGYDPSTAKNHALTEGHTFVSLTPYTVTYYSNGATNGQPPQDMATYLQGTSVTVLGNTGELSRIGYTFIGWNTRSTGTGTTYTPGDTFSMGLGNVSLYAMWEQIPLPTITLQGDNPIHINQGDDYNDPGAIAWDYADAALPVANNASIINPNVNVVGEYTITYTAMDEFDRQVQTNRQVIVMPNRISAIGGYETITVSAAEDGATLSLHNSTGVVATGIADSSGHYEFTNVDAGSDYYVTQTVNDITSLPSDSIEVLKKIAPQAPMSFIVPSYIKGGKHSFHWGAVAEEQWGTGANREYVVELYDAHRLILTDSVDASQSSVTLDVPFDVNTEEAMLRIKSSTDHGESNYVESDPFVIDNILPTLTSVSFVSNNARTNWAKIDDMATLSFTSSEELDDLPLVSIAGHVIAVEKQGSQQFSAAYTLSDSDIAGVLEFSIDFSDMAGNKGLPVTQTTDRTAITFDPEPPAEATFHADKTHPTHTNVVVSIKYPTDAADREYKLGDEHWKAYIDPIVMTENGTLYARSYDLAGNISPISSIQLDNIYRNPPSLTYERSTELWTNENLTISIQTDSPDHLDITVKKWASGEHGISYFSLHGHEIDHSSFQVSKNGLYTIFLQDSAGNTTVDTFEVDNIDKDDPIIHFKITPDALTNEAVTVTANVYDLSSAIKTSKWTFGAEDVYYFEHAGESFVDGSMSFQAETNGIYTVFAEDVAGNRATATIEISNISTEKPVIKFTSIPAEPTKGNVTITADVYAKNGIAVQKFDYGHYDASYFVHDGQAWSGEDITLTDNGWVTVYVQDKASNITVQSIEISHIDRIPPVLTLKGQAAIRILRGTSYTDLGATALDNHDGDISSNIIVSGDLVDTTKVGEYVIYYDVVDRAGNPAEQISRTVRVYTQPSPSTPQDDDGQSTGHPDDPSADAEQASDQLVDISDHWAGEGIKKLVNLGIINGYPDRTFKPDQTITRAEFITLVVNLYSLQDLAEKSVVVREDKIFTDTTDHWAKQSITFAYTNGLINGIDEHHFAPDAPMTREQMAVILMNLLQQWGKHLSNGDGNAHFMDETNMSSWAISAVHAVFNEGIMEGYPDQSFQPKRLTTRGEAATVLLRMITHSSHQR